MSNACGCYYGGDCTKTTQCANEQQLEYLQERISELEISWKKAIEDCQTKTRELSKQHGRISELEELKDRILNQTTSDMCDLRMEIKELRAKYNDLLYQVASKFPGETRHETAKRYIEQAEMSDDGPAQEQEDE